MKRILSFLMALVLTFGLVSMADFTVLAAEEDTAQKAPAESVILERLEISAPVPVPGEKTEDYQMVAPEGAPYSIEDVAWTDLTDDNYFPELFQKGHLYLIHLNLAPASGYAFAGEEMQVVINGEICEFYENPDGITIRANQLISLIENEQVIDFAEVWIDGIQPGGKTKDVVATIPEDAPYTIQEILVQETENWERVDVFNKDDNYRIGVILRPKEGFVFAEDMDGTVNGEQYRPWTFNYGTGAELGMDISFYVDHVELGELPYFIEPGTAEVPFIEENFGHANITDIKWVDTDRQPVKAFADGNVYYLAVELTADGYRTFLDGELDLWLQNYIPYDVEYASGKEVTVYFKYADLLPAINKIPVQMTAPEVGMEFSQLIPDVGKYGVLSDWQIFDFNQDVSLTSGTVEKYHSYQAYFAFAAPDGYRYGDYVDLGSVIDEFPYHVERGITATELCFYYNFSTYELLPSVEITADLPVPGMNVADCTVSIPEDAPYALDSWQWMDSLNGGPAQGVFTADGEYYLEMHLSALGNVAFDDKKTTVTLNGAEIGWHSRGGGREMYAALWRDFRVDYVRLGELPEQIEAGTAEIPAVEAFSQDLTVIGVRWMNSEKTKEVTKFKEGNVYYLAVELQTENGKIFNINEDFYIEHWNGTTTDYTIVADNKIIAYFRYSLEPDVGKVTVTPGNWGVGMDVADITVSIDGNAVIEYISVSDMGNYEEVTSGKIEANKTYYIQVSVNAKEGYRFGNETEFEFVNDDYIVDWWGGETYRVLEIYFSTKTKITEVKVDLQGVGIGKKIAEAKAVLPENAPYYATLSWYDVTNGWTKKEDGVFQDGHKYEVSIVLYAKENYAFPREFAVTLDGVKSTGYSWSAGENADLYKYFSYLKPINRVDLPKLPDIIKKGQTLPTNFRVDKDALYTLTATWINCEGDKAQKADKNDSYILVFQLSAKEGYKFADDVLVCADGKQVLNYMTSDETELQMLHVYNVGIQEISRIDLTTSTIGAGKTAGQVSVPKDAKYTLEDFSWFGNMDGNVYEADGIETFVQGMYVYLNTVLTAEDGCAFAHQPEIYINGVKAGYVRYINIGAYAMFAVELGKVGEQAQKPVKSGAPKVTVKDGVLSWNADANAASYEIYRSTKKSSGFKKIDTVTGNTYFDTDAEGGKTYYYKVKVISTFGSKYNSADSKVVSVVYKLAVPVVDITTDAESGKPVITWEKVSGAKSYDVYFATSANGNYKKLGNTKNLSYTDTKIAVGATRFYKVKAIGSKSAYNSLWSDVLSARAVYAAPDVKGTTEEVYGDPLLTWTRNKEVAGYRIFRRLEGEEGFTLIDQVNERYFRDTTAPLNVLCYYKVQTVGKDESLNSAMTDVIQVYSTMGQPIVDAYNKDSGRPYLCWYAVEGAAKYEIYRSEKEKSGYVLIHTTTNRDFTDTTAAGGKTYYYKVAAVSANDLYAESRIQKLYVKCATPQGNVEKDPVSGKPVLTWEKVDGAKKYEIWRSVNGGKLKKLTATTKLTYTDSSASAGNEYSYELRALGKSSSYDSKRVYIGSQSVVCAQPQVTVKTDSKGKPVVSWKKVSGANKYIVAYVDISNYLYTEDGPSQDYIEENLQYVELSSKKTSVTLTDTQIGCLYLVYVVAVPKNEALSSALSEPQIIDACCVAPKIKVKTVDGYNGATWNHVKGANFYMVYRSTKKSSGYEAIGTVYGNSFIDGGAVKGKTYYYKVTACTMHESETYYTESAFSNVIKIKTKK